jgi:broad specificity phosphatase PhoE
VVAVSTQLWLVRHGATDWSDAGRLTGWKDIPLNDAGRRQARHLRGRLATTKFDGIWSSDLARAMETARLAAGGARADKRLRELDFGDIEGWMWDQCSPELQAQLLAFDRFVAPGGESVSELTGRILAFMGTLSEGRHLIFTHGGAIRILVRLTGLDDPVPAGSLTQLSDVWWGGEGERRRLDARGRGCRTETRKGGAMFVQVIQGKVKDPAGLRKQWERWDQELKPAAEGYLGSTAGITGDGEFIALARFESEEAARANSDSPAQTAWWEEMSQYLDDTMFHDCTLVDLMSGGGSDDAGFVQVIQGKVKDVEKARQMDSSAQSQMEKMRPDVIGGIVAWHPQNGRFTNAIYFTSEAEAREKERETSDSPEFQEFMKEWEANSDGEPKFLDITEPWFSSK